MPLAFRSTSHGTVVFGYFNIDTDWLLLGQLFFDTDAFCRAVIELAGGRDTAVVSGHFIDDPRDVGSVMGAIHGVDTRGFMGEVYRRFPFPEDPAEFHQRADGVTNRGVVADILRRWARPVELDVAVDAASGSVAIDELVFENAWFGELVAYVWRGGWPRWLDDRRPRDVEEMKRAVEASAAPLFETQRWELQLCQT